MLKARVTLHTDVQRFFFFFYFAGLKGFQPLLYMQLTLNLFFKQTLDKKLPRNLNTEIWIKWDVRFIWKEEVQTVFSNGPNF
jgi:hypothetical protein